MLRDSKGRFLPGQIPPTAYKPGKEWRGNSKGRPPFTISITELFKQLLEENPDDAKAVARAWLRKAKTGQIDHLKVTLRQLKELEPEGVDVTSKGEAIGTFILRTAEGDKTAKELKDAGTAD